MRSISHSLLPHHVEGRSAEVTERESLFFFLSFLLTFFCPCPFSPAPVAQTKGHARAIV